MSSRFVSTSNQGLSPRVRGNQPADRLRGVDRRSIPAGAGEPDDPQVHPAAREVYPRGCGGTMSNDWVRPGVEGLSPRVRGNQRARRSRHAKSRSIPAGAGEPTRRPSARWTCWVYPRGCGGTSTGRPDSMTRMGLSPRVRGNRHLGGAGGRGPGSIPAGAGEPGTAGSRSATRRVYPRGCGGTPPSPVWPGKSRGSIPAGAGEPAWTEETPTVALVYPRGCGGTSLSRLR